MIQIGAVRATLRRLERIRELANLAQTVDPTSEFIACVRRDVPALLDAIEALREALFDMINIAEDACEFDPERMKRVTAARALVSTDSD